MRFRSIVSSVVVACCASAAFADGKQPCPVTGSYEVDYFSKYVWRGMDWTDGGVLWQTFTLNYMGFSGYVFGGMDLTNTNSYPPMHKPAGNFTEYDLGLSYTLTKKGVGYTVGFQNYVFPRTGTNQMSEAYVAVALPVFLSPTLSVYRDVEQAQGWYADLAASYTFPKGFRLSDTTKLPLQVTASLGGSDAKFSEFFYGDNNAGFADLTLGASTAIPFGKNAALTPSVKYSTLLTDAMQNNLPHRSNLWFGLSFTYGF